VSFYERFYEIYEIDEFNKFYEFNEFNEFYIFFEFYEFYERREESIGNIKQNTKTTFLLLGHNQGCQIFRGTFIQYTKK
jgi:hypothetical protein